MDSTTLIESTPLLSHFLGRPENSLPRVIEVIMSPANSPQDWRPEDHCPPELRSDASKTAYQLLTLLRWRVRLQKSNNIKRDLWEYQNQQRRGSQDVETLEHKIDRVWDSFAREYHASDEIETVLWLPFPVGKITTNIIRVVDYLPSAHETLLTNSLIDLSLKQTWKYGLAVSHEMDSNALRRLMSLYDSFGTPRVFHLMDLIAELSFVACLAYFLLYPPSNPVVPGNFTEQGCLEYFLTLFPIALLARPFFSLRSLSPAVVLLVFVSAFPSVPHGGESFFTALHLALAFHILCLHFPVPPSPTFLSSDRRFLPLSVFLTQGISRMFWPVILFFLPVLLLSALLLSLSIGDMSFYSTLLQASVEPSPMESRMAFLLLFVIVLLLLLLCLILGASKYPWLSPTQEARDPPANIWDRYSRPVGLQARRSFISALLRYSEPSYSPPPWNVLVITLVQLPSFVLSLLGFGTSVFTFKRALWRATVGPVVFMLGSVWLWGLWR